MKTTQNPQLDLFSNTLISEVKVSYHPNFRPSSRPKVKCSRDAYNIVVDLWPDIDYCESFGVLLLNRSNAVIGLSIISTGGVAGTVADPKKVFQIALTANASSIMLIHNHPSGSIIPSEADIILTRKMKEAGIFLDLHVMDHQIITSETYFSFADEGQL